MVTLGCSSSINPWVSELREIEKKCTLYARAEVFQYLKMSRTSTLTSKEFRAHPKTFV